MPRRTSGPTRVEILGQVNGYVANTDFDWYRFLRDRSSSDEVNFWQPSSQADFKAIPPGAPFFFRLKGPHNAIAGFGYFVRKLVLPAWEAWEAFGEANGVSSLADLTRRIAKYRRGEPHDPHGHQWIGCLIVSTPVFFAPDEWVRQPNGWSPNIVQGKRLDLASPDGRRILDTCSAHALAQETIDAAAFEEETGSRYGAPRLLRPRLGQSTFRYAVRDAYGACAVTTEHAYPVLEAAHIRPYSEGGRHEVANGLLLRADLHRLFDRGYVTVTTEHRLQVSPRLRDEWQNGRQYYAMDGARLALPRDPEHHPDPEALAFHNETIFRDGF